MTSAQRELSGYSTLAEPDLLFSGNQRHKHPLMGLIEHGPYGLRFSVPQRLRLALLATKKDMPRLRGLVKEFEQPATPREAKNYYPAYPGFTRVFRIPIEPIDDRMAIEIPASLETFA
jgi:hypothetical protein